MLYLGRKPLIKMKWLLKLLGSEEDYWKEQYEISKKNYDELLIECEKLKTTIEELKKQQNLVEPKVYGTITFKELWDLLRPLTSALFLSDETYSLTTKEEAEKFSKETKVQYNKWLKEQFDCDEFSFASMGYWNEGLKQFAYGIAWSKTHAFNIMIDNKKQIWIVEPQNNIYFKLEDIKINKLYYPLRLILI